jgi:hypothetical protein
MPAKSDSVTMIQNRGGIGDQTCKGMTQSLGSRGAATSLKDTPYPTCP